MRYIDIIKTLVARITIVPNDDELEAMIRHISESQTTVVLSFINAHAV